MEPYRSPDPTSPAPVQPAGDIDTKVATRRAPWLRLTAIGVLLVVLIAVLLKLVEGPNAPAVTTVAIWVALGFATLILAVAVVFYRQLMVVMRQNNDGIALLASGRVDEAIVLFERLAVESRRFPAYRAQFLANLGTSWLRKGDTDRALKYLRAAYDSRWLDRPQDGRNHTVLLNALGICHLVRDQLDAARQFQRDAHARVPASQRGLLLLGDALVAARSGEYAEVSALTSSRWSEGEGALGPFQMRALRLVRAFALSELDAAQHAREIATLIEGARPSLSGEFDYLLSHWPAFRAFLAQHEFATAA